MGQRRCMPTMKATMAMAETAMAAATTTLMMPLLLPTAMMLVRTLAVICVWQLDVGILTTMMGQQRCKSTMTVMAAMAETATATATVMAMAMVMMPPPPPMATMLMKMTVAIQGQRLDDGNWTTIMGQ
jgi:hypothetical protein